MFTFEATKTTPFAPPELEGEYKLTIKGRHMKMTKMDDGIKARATCNKTDDWNMVDGINTCLGRIQEKKKDADKIKVGDKVQVIDSGKSYSAYIDWVLTNISKRTDIVRFCYDVCAKNGTIGTVRYVAPHGIEPNRMLAYIRVADYTGDKYYLIDTAGLKKI